MRKFLPVIAAAAAALGITAYAATSQAKQKPGTAPPKPGEPASTPAVVTQLEGGKSYTLNVFAQKGQTPTSLVLSIAFALQGQAVVAPSAIIAKSDVDVGGGVKGDQWVLQAVVAPRLPPIGPIGLPFTMKGAPWSIMSAVDASQLPPKTSAAQTPGTSPGKLMVKTGPVDAAATLLLAATGPYTPAQLLTNLLSTGFDVLAFPTPPAGSMDPHYMLSGVGNTAGIASFAPGELSSTKFTLPAGTSQVYIVLLATAPRGPVVLPGLSTIASYPGLAPL